VRALYAAQQLSVRGSRSVTSERLARGSLMVSACAWPIPSCQLHRSQMCVTRIAAVGSRADGLRRGHLGVSEIRQRGFHFADFFTSAMRAAGRNSRGFVGRVIRVAQDRCSNGGNSKRAERCSRSGAGILYTTTSPSVPVSDVCALVRRRVAAPVRSSRSMIGFAIAFLIARARH